MQRPLLKIWHCWKISINTSTILWIRSCSEPMMSSEWVTCARRASGQQVDTVAYAIWSIWNDGAVGVLFSKRIAPRPITNNNNNNNNEMSSDMRSDAALIGIWARGQPPPQTRAKPLFFGQKLNFSGRNQEPKMKNKYFLYIFNEKYGIHFV